MSSKCKHFEDAITNSIESQHQVGSRYMLIGQNRPGFVDDVTKTFGVFLGSQIAVHLQNTNANFHKVV